MAASLRHANVVLSAAHAAGFRESGLQSLKVLDSPNALPIIAVRTTGLGLSSIVASVDHSDVHEEIRTLVDETYLGILVEEANARFKLNSERIARFEEALMRQSQWCAEQDPALAVKASNAKQRLGRVDQKNARGTIEAHNASAAYEEPDYSFDLFQESYA